jgi:methylated-DNA-[protein]-cysteine S-methyltransferase
LHRKGQKMQKISAIQPQGATEPKDQDHPMLMASAVFISPLGPLFLCLDAAGRLAILEFAPRELTALELAQIGPGGFGKAGACGALSSGPLEVSASLPWAGRLKKITARLYPKARLVPATPSQTAPIFSALEAYFAGKITALEAINIHNEQGTPFQQRVWAGLRQIPAGKTWSYSRLAHEIGAAGAVRAVGLANGANPISLVVPCHRVIGKDGSLTGYGGGLQRKAWLLAHEGVALPSSPAIRDLFQR